MSEIIKPPDGSGWFWVDDPYWETAGGQWHYYWPGVWQDGEISCLCGSYPPTGELVPEEDTGPDIWDAECKVCSEAFLNRTMVGEDAWEEFYRKKDSPDRS